MRSRLPRLLPGEWVLLGFLGYAVLRLIAAGSFELNQKSIPRTDFFLVILLVFLARVLVQYRRTPWPPSAVSQRRLHFVFLFLFLAAMPALLPAPPPMRPAEGGWEGQATEVFLKAYGWLQVVGLILLPFLLFWVASAQHIKLHGRLDTVSMVRSGWRPTVAMLRDWIPVISLLYFYGLMGPVIGKGLFGDQDALLARIDRALFLGHDPRMLLQGIISRPLSEWCSGCYVFYLMLFPLVLGPIFAKTERAPFREIGFALSLTFAVGYIFYTIVPAQGPLFLDHFDVSLDAFLGARLKDQLMDRTRVPRDCFPSLHTGVSLLFLWGAYRHVRTMFWVLLPVVVTIPFACVYLRYHYVVDILAGIALFVGVATLTVRSKSLQRAFQTGAT